MKHIFKLTALATAIVLVGCSDDSAGKKTEGEPGAQTTAAQTKLFETREANVEQCANGGEVIDMGIDSNGNSKLDASEITASQVICNGVDGQDGTNGLTPLVLITPADAQTCASGGTVITTGIDQNADGLLTEDEAPATATLCNGADGVNGQDGTNGTDGVDGTDGANGKDGQDGTAGNDGLTPLIKVETIAAGDICPNGGQKVTSGIDADGDAVIDAATAAEATICNGVDANNLLSVSNIEVVEGEMATFTLTLAQAQSADTSFFVTTQNSNAEAGSDYELTVAEVPIAAGVTSATVAVKTLADTHFESDEYFTLQVSGAGAQATGVAKIIQPAFSAQPLTVQVNANSQALVGTDVVIELSDQINDIAADAISVTSADGVSVLGSANYAVLKENGTPILSFTPSASLALGTTYTVAVKPVTTFGLDETKNLADVSFTTESQAFAYRNASTLPLQNVSNLWQWLEEGIAREIKAGDTPLTFAGSGIEFNGQYYFAGSTTSNATQADSQLYVSDGSSHGTRLLTDAEGIAIATNPGNFTVFNGELYFTASTADNLAQQLWKTDGSAANSVAIAGTEALEISELTVAGETLYYVVDASTSNALLWSVDAANAATKVPSVGSKVDYIGQLTAFNNSVYFVGYRKKEQRDELFTVTEGGIDLALELNTINNKSSNFQNLQVIDGQLFFTAEPTGGGRFGYLYDGVNDPQLIINGAQVTGQVGIAQFNTTDFILDSVNPRYLRLFDSEVELAAFNSTSGMISTPAGVVVAGDFNGTKGLWLFTDAAPLEIGALPTIAIETGNITLEGLVGDQLLYSVTDNSITQYLLTDLVSKDPDTQKTVVTEVSNELVVQ